MCIHRYKVLARFGLMHMVATNLCVWFDNIVRETIREIQTSSDAWSTNYTLIAKGTFRYNGIYIYCRYKGIYDYNCSEMNQNYTVFIDQFSLYRGDLHRHVFLI